jgi:hypothetical protein
MAISDPIDSPNSDFDSPWKRALEDYFEEFMAFFFPDIDGDIDWERGYEFLDTQLQQIVREAETGKRFADKLVKLWRKSGEQTCVFVHIEIQSQREPGFEGRMFTYYNRLRDRFDESIVSLAVLADTDHNWRPQTFRDSLWGCEVQFTFPIVKLLDYGQQWQTLEQSTNPFATVVMAHLKTQETQGNPTLRRDTKLILARALFQRGYPRETVLRLLGFIDWLLALPSALEDSFWQEIIAIQENNPMPYVLSIERMALARGREEGRDRQADLLLKLFHLKFHGTAPGPIATLIRSLTIAQLNDLDDVALELDSWAQILDFILVGDHADLGKQVQPGALDQVAIAYFGEVSEAIQAKLAGLSVERVQSLAAAMVDWRSVEELQNWLA